MPSSMPNVSESEPTLGPLFAAPVFARRRPRGEVIRPAHPTSQVERPCVATARAESGELPDRRAERQSRQALLSRDGWSSMWTSSRNYWRRATRPLAVRPRQTIPAASPGSPEGRGCGPPMRNETVVRRRGLPLELDSARALPVRCATRRCLNPQVAHSQLTDVQRTRFSAGGLGSILSRA